jgi:ABC-2 type transport system permease protein
VTADARTLARPSPIARIVGLGSIYGKTVRDSRRAAILVGGVAALFVLATGAPYATADFATVEARKVFIASLTALPPAIRGLLGEPINLDTLGGFVSWRVGNFLPVMLGLWPVLALSGTLAGEAAKGSLDLLASTPHSRPSIALEKLAGHVTAVVIAMAILALAIFGVGQAFARLPGDDISLSAAIGQAVLYGVMMLAAGGAAFATAPFLGRTRGLGIGLIALFASYLIYGYSTLSPIIEALKPLSFFVWTAGHRPIAGVTDWPSVALLGAVDLVLFAIGVIAFTRRDLGSSANVGWLRLPSLPAGIAGPFSRQLADRFGIALAWGVGIGAYGIIIVASADAFG